MAPPTLRRAHRTGIGAGLIVLAACLSPMPSAAEDAAWVRSGATALPNRACQELAILGRGEGLLEVRFRGEPLPAVGPDPKVTGLSLLVDSDPHTPTTVARYHRTGSFGRAFSANAPLRWQRRGNRLCFASGARPFACTSASEPPLSSQRIAFGAGWRTELRPCPALAHDAQIPTSAALLSGLAIVLAGALWWGGRRREHRWLAVLAPAGIFAVLAMIQPLWPDPRLTLPGAALALGLIPLRLLRHRRELGWTDAGYSLLALLFFVAILALPHPVRDRGALPALPPPETLWTDPAWWNPHAVHQSLAFRDQPVAGLKASQELLWLVVGGSVVFGDGVPAQATFTAAAERQLRASGHPVRLLNAGVPAWNLGHVEGLLDEIARDLPITGIVIASVLNNAALSLPGPLPPRCAAGLWAGNACNLMRSPLQLVWLKYFLPKPGNLERYRGTLARIIAAERERGRRLVLLDETSRWQLADDWRDARDQRYRDALADVGSRRGLELHGLAEVVAAVPEDGRFLDPIHLAPGGHAAVGARLAAILADLPGFPGPAPAGSVPVP